MSLRQIIQATTPSGHEPDMSISVLFERLQPCFPEHQIDVLLDKFGLITKSKAVDPLLIHQGLVKVNERYPSSKVLILETTITEHGSRVVKEILKGYLNSEGISN